MGDILKQHLNAEVNLIPGSGGIFEVAANGRKIFSKADAKRFPEPDEIIEKLKTIDS